jgi:hypothetical protein
VTGVGSERRAAARGKARADADHDLVIGMDDGRVRHGGWAVGGILIGGFLIAVLGVVGKGLGVLLLAIGAWNLRGLIRALRHPAGTFRITRDEAVIPAGLCRPDPLTLPLDQVRHAYLVRRAVPWLVTGPVLVVETGDRRLVYPRDWFVADADQRRIAHALNHGLGRL